MYTLDELRGVDEPLFNLVSSFGAEDIDVVMARASKVAIGFMKHGLVAIISHMDLGNSDMRGVLPDHMRNLVGSAFTCAVLTLEDALRAENDSELFKYTTEKIVGRNAIEVISLLSRYTRPLSDTFAQE